MIRLIILLFFIIAPLLGSANATSGHPTDCAPSGLLMQTIFDPLAAGLPKAIEGELSAFSFAQPHVALGSQQAGDHADAAHQEGHGEHAAPSPVSVIPFLTLLLMIATGPLFYESFWHHHYPKIAIGLGAVTVSYYLFFLHNQHGPVHAAFEYFQFICLISALYIASGGILIEIDKQGKPLLNTTILLIGSVIANVIGTTGASMLLIRPFIRLNRERIQPYHIVFFIFIVSNIGGSLTPIGDPPLFLGFLKGVPFGWTITHSWPMWAFSVLLMGLIFFLIDTRNSRKSTSVAEGQTYTQKIKITGAKNFLWLGVVIGAVFIDPSVQGFEWVPSITYDGQKFSFVRELAMLFVAFMSFKFASPVALKGNEFNFEPIREVAFIFIGIFCTMMPALELVANFAASEEGKSVITHNTLYWGSGVLSGVLDNAPTYLNFLTAAMAAQGASIGSKADVVAFAMGDPQFVGAVIQLSAISIASVFFGAMTYIGNGPNFMVKSIAEQVGVQMPSFFGYIIRFSLPILLPALVLVWLIFFAFSH